MDLHQLRFALLKLTMVVLAASSWILVSFVLATRPEEPGSTTLASLARLPASLKAEIPSLVKARVNDPIAMDVVKLPCWDKTTEAAHHTAARWVRLTGATCQTEGSDEEITVCNLANGYVATVFPLQASGLTTDFIPLQAGANKILIHFNQGAGVAVESQVLFNRD